MNLRLLQLSDSALPIGGYTHSWGLESAISRGLVHDAATLEQWTSGWLRYSLGPLEGVVVAAVCRAVPLGAWRVVERAGEILGASVNPPTIRQASQEMGEQLLALGSTWAWSVEGVERIRQALAPGAEVNPWWHHAVVFGLLAALAGATPQEALTGYLHQSAVGMIGAGVRAVPVGHTHGQQVLAYLHPLLTILAADLAACELDAAGNCCPFYEVLCDEQTRLFTRLFRS
jgi:urease accessory protein